MKFIVEQLAICPANPEAAIKLLTEMGAAEWARDHVVAAGDVYGEAGRNEADLAFNYDLLRGPEFEVLHYTRGHNWMNEPSRVNSVSHIGMHCSEEELEAWRKFFADRKIPVAQEVFTESHTNPVIAGKRWYRYVIFSTKQILGVDCKFIVRRDSFQGDAAQ
jgi:hypothetical protein